MGGVYPGGLGVDIRILGNGFLPLESIDAADEGTLFPFRGMAIYHNWTEIRSPVLFLARFSAR